MEKLVEMHIPNILGSEKEAIKKAVSIARKMGFSDDRVENLKTVVSEACINAIEHGNKFDLNTKVGVTLASDDTALEITVHDEGNGIDPEKIPKNRKNPDVKLEWDYQFVIGSTNNPEDLEGPAEPLFIGDINSDMQCPVGKAVHNPCQWVLVAGYAFGPYCWQ